MLVAPAPSNRLTMASLKRRDGPLDGKINSTNLGEIRPVVVLFIMVLFTNAVAALVVASLAAAVTPEGFEPQVDAALMVIYGDTPGEDGAALEKSRTSTNRSGRYLAKNALI